MEWLGRCRISGRDFGLDSEIPLLPLSFYLSNEVKKVIPSGFNLIEVTRSLKKLLFAPALSGMIEIIGDRVRWAV